MEQEISCYTCGAKWITSEPEGCPWCKLKAAEKERDEGVVVEVGRCNCASGITLRDPRFAGLVRYVPGTRLRIVEVPNE